MRRTFCSLTFDVDRASQAMPYSRWRAVYPTRPSSPLRLQAHPIPRPQARFILRPQPIYYAFDLATTPLTYLLRLLQQPYRAVFTLALTPTTLTR